jgi:hypothetical protein
MKTYILDIIPKIQKYSKKIDDLSVLVDKHWVILNEENSTKSVLIFRKKHNQLLISENGNIEKGTWEYLGNNSIMIERKNGTYLYRHGFVDDYILALKIDGKEEYALLVNDEWFDKHLKTISKILDFLNKKYIKTENSYKSDSKEVEKKTDFDEGLIIFIAIVIVIAFIFVLRVLLS